MSLVLDGSIAARVRVDATYVATTDPADVIRNCTLTLERGAHYRLSIENLTLHASGTTATALTFPSTIHISLENVAGLTAIGGDVLSTSYTEGTHKPTAGWIPIATLPTPMGMIGTPLYGLKNMFFTQASPAVGGLFQQSATTDASSFVAQLRLTGIPNAEATVPTFSTSNTLKADRRVSTRLNASQAASYQYSYDLVFRKVRTSH